MTNTITVEVTPVDKNTPANRNWFRKGYGIFLTILCLVVFFVILPGGFNQGLYKEQVLHSLNTQASLASVLRADVDWDTFDENWKEICSLPFQPNYKAGIDAYAKAAEEALSGVNVKHLSLTYDGFTGKDETGNFIVIADLIELIQEKCKSNVKASRNHSGWWEYFILLSESSQRRREIDVIFTRFCGMTKEAGIQQLKRTSQEV